ncbi:MAG: glutamyl-tRNA reductase [Planctomycetota bacterium]|nr:glutamyl-tRNA reductase [Planctomycetota bacterium]MDA1141377.1 glutamyl-tRNA reductase [Planctomycetota bacterium]
MKLATIGLNFRTAPVEIREQLAFDTTEIIKGLSALKSDFSMDEAVILSTCNRVEIYASREAGNVHYHDLEDFLSRFHQVDPRALNSSLYKKRDTVAIEHLFHVAASIDSMVLGETQILAQVKESYHLSKRQGMIGRLFDALFQNAFSVAKHIHTQTGIGQRKVSVCSVAVDFAEKIFNLEGRTILVLGAGKMSELTLTHMVKKGAAKVLVSNRTFEKAEELASRFGGEAVPFETLSENLGRADIVISSTGSQDIIVTPEHVRDALRRRRYQPMVLIDIAVPRDIDPAVNEIDNVYHYDIDDLESIVSQNLAERQGEVDACRQIVSQKVGEFIRDRRIIEAGPVISQLTQYADSIREQELERVLNKLGEISDKDREEIEYLTKRIINKLLNKPIAAIRDAVAEGDGYQMLNATQKLFDLDDGEDEPDNSGKS